MRETYKTLALLTEEEKSFLQGDGIDIGCGDSPVTDSVLRFEKQDGDANQLSRYVDKQFDFIWSSHVLEHMKDPRYTLHDWWKLLRKGGHLFLMLPDEDLYEQGWFPSRYNRDHQWTFTIGKRKSWSHRSINLYDLLRSLPSSNILKIELHDNHYDRNMLGAEFPRLEKNAFVAVVLKYYKIFHKMSFKSETLESLNEMRYLCQQRNKREKDQTLGNALAQIFCLVRKD